MVNEDQTTSVELAMEEVRPLRHSDSAANVEIQDGQLTTESQQSCGTLLYTYEYIRTNLYSAKNRENESEALAQGD